ncbi:MAG: hypothetical protein CL851_06745 [Crocinitomicaceae bacterium]|nr:hypothetical protein [Crocinitomicaceae bacterium]|tara:strand:- start:1509 stop:2555 length:1047 start_codon:yes stop_codon:yes gene_type:complete
MRSLRKILKKIINFLLLLSLRFSNKNKLYGKKIIVFFDPTLGIGDIFMYRKTLETILNKGYQLEVISKFPKIFISDLIWKEIEEKDFNKTLLNIANSKELVFIPKLSAKLSLSVILSLLLRKNCFVTDLNKKKYFSGKDIKEYKNKSISLKGLEISSEIKTIISAERQIKRLELNRVDFDLNLNRYIVFSCNGTEKIKMMKASKWLDIYNQIDKNISVVIIGRGKDKEFNDILVSEIEKVGKNFLDLTNKTNLHQMFDVIRNSEYVVTTDSGPLHVAHYFGKETLALFGPSDPELVLDSDFVGKIVKKADCECTFQEVKNQFCPFYEGCCLNSINAGLEFETFLVNRV